MTRYAVIVLLPEDKRPPDVTWPEGSKVMTVYWQESASDEFVQHAFKKAVLQLIGAPA